MKKFISLFLSLTMLLSITAGIDLSAYANDFLTATPISTGGAWYNDSLDVKQENDYFSFEVKSDSKIIIKFMIYMSAYMHLYDSDFNELFYANSTSATASSPVTLTKNLGLEKGVYYILINSPGSNNTGKYRLSVTAEPYGNQETEPNDFDHATVLPCDKTIKAAFTYQDGEDWFKLYVPVNATVNIRMISNISTSARLYNNDLTKYWFCNFNSYPDDTEIAVDTYNLTAGTYYLHVFRVFSDSGSYTVNWSMNVPVSKPSSLKVSTRNTTSLKLSWSKVSGASGYQLQQYKSNKWTTIKTTTATAYTVSKLAASTTYKFRVRAYKTINSKNYYSDWTNLTTPTKPSTASISSLKSSKSKQLTVKWKKLNCTGYQIQYSTSSKFKSPKTVTITKNSTTSKTVSKLKGKKKYYVRIRAYKTVNGTRYYGSWSKAKSVTTKK
ncbi:MAG: fibronectin type III domain-containing protein [Eubacterium sp.]